MLSVLLGQAETVRVEPGQGALCLESGKAFFAVVGRDWTASATSQGERQYRLTVIDGSGKKAMGFIGATGAQESLGEELLTNGTLEYWASLASPFVWEAIRGVPFQETAELRPGTTGKYSVKMVIKNGKNSWGPPCANISQTITIENGRLYKATGWMKAGPAGQAVQMKLQHSDGSGISIIGSYSGKEWKENVFYFVPTRNPNEEIWVYFFAVGEDETFGYADDFSFREVSSPGKNCVRIYPDRKSSQQRWSTVDKGFDPYEISQYIVEEAR